MHKKHSSINRKDEKSAAMPVRSDDALEKFNSCDTKRFSAMSSDYRFASFPCHSAFTYAVRNPELESVNQSYQDTSFFPGNSTLHPNHYDSYSPSNERNYQALCASLSGAASAISPKPREVPLDRPCFLPFDSLVGSPSQFIASPASYALSAVSSADADSRDHFSWMLELMAQPAAARGFHVCGQNSFYKVGFNMTNQASACHQESMVADPPISIEPGHSAISYAGRLVEGLLLPRDFGAGLPSYAGAVSVLDLGGSGIHEAR